MSWANQIHKQRDRDAKRKREIIEDGRIFYHVMFIAIGRIWKDRTLRIQKDPQDFVQELCAEMERVFGEPGDYAAIAEEETGITLSMNE